jgi:cytochrome c-type biogenesis protein CcmH/NrfG
MRREHLDEARHHLEETLRWGGNSDRCDAYNNLGIIEMRAGNSAAGRALFDAARRTQPGEPNSYLYLARSYFQDGRVDSARAVLRDGLSRAYPLDPLTQALAAVDAGRSF